MSLTGAHESYGGLVGGPDAQAPSSQQSFDLDRPLREARDAFEKCYFEFHQIGRASCRERV